MRNNEIYEMGLTEPATLTIRTELDHHNHHYLDSISSPHMINETSHLKSIFCSPTSPPPQFPAIAESEINEIHGNYTVVRSGAIIEKNGTYYSNDGTIRGYSGTVKKMANSKTLNEIFSNRSNELNKQQNNKIVKQESVNNNNNNNSSSRTCNFTKPSPLSPVTEAISPVSSINSNQPNTPTKKEPKFITNTLSSNSNIFKKTPFTSNISKTLPNNRDQQVNERPKSAILNNNNNNKTKDEVKQSRLSAIIYNNNSSNKQCDISANIALINQEILSTFKPALPPRKDYPIQQHQQNNSPIPSPPPPPPPPPPPQFAGENECHGFDQTMNLDNVLINDYVKKNLQLNNDPIILEVTNDDEIRNNNNQENNFVKTYKNKLDSNNNNMKKVGAYIASISIASTQSTNGTTQKPQPPKVAPKNFSHDAIESLNKKNNVLSIRENLMESIKNFNIANLRSSSINT